MKTCEFKIEGMTCDHCAVSIQNKLVENNGIYKSIIDDKYDKLLPNIPVSLYKIDGTNIIKVTKDIRLIEDAINSCMFTIKFYKIQI